MTMRPNPRLHRTRRNRRGSGITTFGSCLRETTGAGAPVKRKMLGGLLILREGIRK